MIILNAINGLKVILLFALWGAVFAPVIPPMVNTWLNHSDNTHAILVPLISTYFAWSNRSKLADVEPTDTFWGWGLLTGSLITYLLCFAGGVAFISRAMIVTSLGGLIWSCFGWGAFRVLAFPLGFLLFMVPVPDSLLMLVSFPLQMWATNISAWLIQLFFIPVYQEGNMLYFAQAQLEVAEACSGIRSIMALTMLSVLLANLTDNSWKKKALLVASAIPIAILANIVRVTGTGILAHFFGARVALGFLHDFSGIVVFFFGFFIMIALSKFLTLSNQP